jgi:ATP-dependent Clp endopeptidase proteolytic subunit ClpP
MYVVDYNSDEPIMLIDRHIGFDEVDGMGIQGDLFARELLELDTMGKKRIQIWINSPGGIVVDGMSIYHAILATKTKVDTRCTGMACSIAGVIFQAGRTREIIDYGILMYHMPFGGDDAKGLDAMKEAIVKMIATRSGMSDEAVEKMMKATTYLTSDEAISQKLADAVIQSGEVNIKRKSPVAVGVKSYHTEANKILNKLFNHKSMNKIANKLNLNEAASEDSIVTAIGDIQNKLSLEQAANKKKDEDLEKMKKELEDKQAECDKLKGDYDKAKADLEESDKKAKAEEDKAKKEKAKNLVDTYKVAGKIKAEAVNSWINKAVDDYDGTKALLDSIPGNKTAIKIETKDTSKGGALADDMAGGVALDMARISNKLGKR